MHGTRRKACVNTGHESLNLYIISHFIFEGEDWKIKWKMFLRKASINKQLIPTLHTTVMATANYRNVQCVVLMLPNSALRSSFIIVSRSEIPGTRRVGPRPLSSLCHSYTASGTVAAHTMLLRWLQQQRWMLLSWGGTKKCPRIPVWTGIFRRFVHNKIEHAPVLVPCISEIPCMYIFNWKYR
jgi:hypothetical protein